MIPAADDREFEDAFAAILAGRPVPSEAAGLAAFSRAVRSSATQPGRPDAALAELLTTGLLTDHSSPSVRTANSAAIPPAPAALRVRIRRRFAMILTALVAKLLSAGAVAHAATGAGIAVVVVTGVGAAGALPGELQTAYSAVVGSQSEDGETTTGDPVDGSGEETSDEDGAPQPDNAAPAEPTENVEAPDAGTAATADQDAQEYRNFGERVSAHAHGDHEPGEHGEWVRENAPDQVGDHRQEGTESSNDAEDTTEAEKREGSEEAEGDEGEKSKDSADDEAASGGSSSGKGGRGRS